MSKVDTLWDDNPVDITNDANLIWSIANKLRGSYMPDKYGDVIIPMTIIRRLECALEPTKDKVVEAYKKDPSTPYKKLQELSGYQFYNTSEFTLKKLLTDESGLEANFKDYLDGFSTNVKELLNSDDTLKFYSHIKTMSKGDCLYSVVKAFSEQDLSPEHYDSIKMGYIFENLIGRFFQNVDAGQYYTGRDIIKVCVSLLIAEGCDDIFDENRVITVCDQACGTGGMLSTAYSYLKHFNPSADIRLFGQEYNGVSYAIGLAEMLIKGQNAEYFKHADTFKQDCFPNNKMRFVIENPPFGTAWSGDKAKAGQEKAVKDEYKNGLKGRWGAGLPAGNDSQLIFMQSAINKMDDNLGRAAIIENVSALVAGNTASGESQIRRWMIENDLIEAIVALPIDLFYNTGIATYIWILSKNKRPERKGKIQLIDATQIYHKLRKALGDKKNEFLPEDRAEITRLYAEFKENDRCKIFDNYDFLYKEYAVMQPLQRSYGFTEERIENMLLKGALKSLWDDVKVTELEEKGKKINSKEKKVLSDFYETKNIYEKILNKLNNSISNKKWLSPGSFMPVLEELLSDISIDKKIIVKIADGLSIMDKEAEIQIEKKGKNKGEVIYDKDTKDIELVQYNETIEEYMDREVLPHVPDAQWFWEENLNPKKPDLKVGAEIPFTRYFYNYQKPKSSEELAKQFIELENNVNNHIASLFEKD